VEERKTINALSSQHMRIKADQLHSTAQNYVLRALRSLHVRQRYSVLTDYTPDEWSSVPEGDEFVLPTTWDSGPNFCVVCCSIQLHHTTHITFRASFLIYRTNLTELYMGRSWVSSVSVVSDYRLNDRGSIPARGKYFSCSLCVQTRSEVHPASCIMGTGGPFPGGKARPGRDTDHPPPSSTNVKNE
jgi:hypothetical protein